MPATESVPAPGGPGVRRGDLAGAPWGFALPAAVLALVAIGLIVTGGFVLAEQEARVARSAQGRTVSLYLAERGLADVVAEWSPSYDTLEAWRSVEVPGSAAAGRWTVQVTRVSPDLFFLRSEAEAAKAGASGARARRSVGTVVRRLAVALDPRSALSTRDPASAADEALRVDEGDRAPDGWGGVCTPLGEGVASLRTEDVGGPGEGADGAEDDPETEERRFRTIERNWEALVGMAIHTIEGPIPGGRPSPSVRNGACDGDDPFNWGNPDDPGAPCGAYFPVIHVRGDAEIGDGTGAQGILLVDGDLTLGDGARYRGLIVVRGRIAAGGGASEVSGAVVAGSAGSAEGVLRLSYSSCALRRAGLMDGALVRVRPLERHGWFDLSRIEG